MAFVWAVTKGVAASTNLAKYISDTGISAIADSRIMNIKTMKDADIKVKFVLIRIPMLSELKDVVEYADYSVTSEIRTIQRLSEICGHRKKEHNIIIMADIGDLREVILSKEGKILCAELTKLNPELKISGIVLISHVPRCSSIASEFGPI